MSGGLESRRDRLELIDRRERDQAPDALRLAGAARLGIIEGNRSRVEGDKRTLSIEPRSYFPDAPVDPTEAAKVDQTDVRRAPGHWISV
jgi:hypothetical protein